MKRRAFLKTVAGAAGVVGRTIHSPRAADAVEVKAMSAGAWPPELSGRHRHKRHRQWWYQTLEQQEQIDLAMRFTLSQKAVVAALPPAWLDLAEKGVFAGKNYRLANEEDVAKLRTMAQQAPAVFQKVDEVAHRGTWDRYRRRGPHEGCESAIA